MLHIQKIGCIIKKTSIYTFNHWIPKLIFSLLIVTSEEMPAKKGNWNFVQRFQLCKIFYIIVIKYAKSSRHFQQSLIFKGDAFCWTELTNNISVAVHLKVHLTMNLK